METMLQFDYSLFEWINQDLQNAFLDSIMPWWRSKFTWIPFYVGLCVFCFVRYRLKGLYFIMALALTVGISDVTSSRLVKDAVKRLRPCKTPELQDTANVLINCGSGYSFTSTHATNHFAMAFFMLFTFCRRFKILRLPLIFWASSIAFGQVYVGVHFPLDVIAGAVIGGILGYFMAKVYLSLERIRIEGFVDSKA